jgi:KDO2-lipid IV(A) lauroyltransferase
VSAAAARRCAWTGPANLLGAWVARLPQSWLLRLGRLLAWLAWPLLRSRRRIAARNIALCFPELDAPAQRRLLRATLRATVTGALETLRAWFAPPARLHGLCDATGLAHLDAARANGRGVLLVTGHMPNFELAGRLLGEVTGAPVSLHARRHNDPCVDGWIDAARRRAFARTIAKKDKDALLQALRDGEVVLYLGDQDFSYRHAFVPFFGVPAATVTALPELMRETGAAALPLWLQREADGRYRLQVEPQWSGWPAGDPAADAARYMRELETVVRRHPEQYLWVHRRFKTRPPGEPGLYA